MYWNAKQKPAANGKPVTHGTYAYVRMSSLRGEQGQDAEMTNPWLIFLLPSKVKFLSHGTAMAH